MVPLIQKLISPYPKPGHCSRFEGWLHHFHGHLWRYAHSLMHAAANSGAAARGSAAVAAELLRRGAGANEADAFGGTPLLMAIDSGNAGMVKVLLEQGADANAGNRFGSTPQKKARACLRALEPEADAEAKRQSYAEIEQLLLRLGARE